MQPINDKTITEIINAIPRVLLTATSSGIEKNDDYMWNIKSSEKSWS